MQKNTLTLFSPSFWLCTGGLMTFALGMAGGAMAQPAAKPRAGVISKKLQTAIEEKLGKPVTPGQLDQMKAAAAARLEAAKVAEEKFIADLAKVTGLSAEDVNAAVNPPRPKKGDAAKPKADAPVEAPAAAPAAT